ncbi:MULTISPECIES: DUF1918 domain-containing protein [unclassified Nocardioides]|uniref:DUF1918 domain-containing protein n=1 Tax=unclassified Nocardioides TaxID=2615069 RepID=UPI000AA7433C|nr:MULTISPECIES: DUF1918 domain-containing protein [unclassified Nocardioides]
MTGMHAGAGDRLIVHSGHVGEAEREAEILEARGSEGTPPFLVRWTDGHESLVYPGPDAQVRPAGQDLPQE